RCYRPFILLHDRGEAGIADNLTQENTTRLVESPGDAPRCRNLSRAVPSRAVPSRAVPSRAIRALRSNQPPGTAQQAVGATIPRISDPRALSCFGNILWFEKCNASEYAAGGHRPTRSDAAKRMSELVCVWSKDTIVRSYRTRNDSEAKTAVKVKRSKTLAPAPFANTWRDLHRSGVYCLHCFTKRFRLVGNGEINQLNISHNQFQSSESTKKLFRYYGLPGIRWTRFTMWPRPPNEEKPIIWYVKGPRAGPGPLGPRGFCPPCPPLWTALRLSAALPTLPVRLAGPSFSARTVVLGRLVALLMVVIGSPD
ncbi:unnamed protein product, partial [Nesidiocoris tenuis]